MMCTGHVRIITKLKKSPARHLLWARWSSYILVENLLKLRQFLFQNLLISLQSLTGGENKLEHNGGYCRIEVLCVNLTPLVYHISVLSCFPNQTCTLLFVCFWNLSDNGTWLCSSQCAMSWQKLRFVYEASCGVTTSKVRKVQAIPRPVW